MSSTVRSGLERDNEGKRSIFKRIATKMNKKQTGSKNADKQEKELEERDGKQFKEEVFTADEKSPSLQSRQLAQEEPDHKGEGSQEKQEKEDPGRRVVISDAVVNHPSIAQPSHAQIIAVRKVLLLYNPESGSRQGKEIAEEAKQMLLDSKIEVHMIALEKQGHGEELCSTIDLTPFDVMCFIGGDGTFHECVNGLMNRQDKEGHKIPVAMIPGGTGNSFALELFGDTDLALAIDTVKRGTHVPIDVAKVTKLEPNEQGDMTNVIYSFNSIHWGLASKVNVTAEKLRWMGKAVRYTTAALMEVINGEAIPAKISFEDVNGKVTEYTEEFCAAIANNVVVAARGMKMAPKAKLNDGLIDLLLIRSNSTLDLVSIFAHVYDGTHTELPYVEYVQVKWFSIVPYKKDEGTVMLESNPEIAEEVVDIDGELKGSTPFRCEVIQNAIKVII